MSRFEPCAVCGGGHLPGSVRQTLCARTRSTVGRKDAQVSSALPRVTSVVTGGLSPRANDVEFTHSGCGVQPPARETPNPIFSRQILPPDVKSEPQPPDQVIPTKRPESKKLVSLYRQAARAAVQEWRRRGFSPDQAFLSEFDVFDWEMESLALVHREALRRTSESMRHDGRPVVVADLAAQSNTDRHCFRALRTLKGLAISPQVLQRAIAWTGPGALYRASEFADLGIVLRAASTTRPLLRRSLSKTASQVTAADLEVISNLLANYAALSAGRVRARFDDDGELEPEVNPQTVGEFTMDGLERVEAALQEIASMAEQYLPEQGETFSLSAFDNHADLLALPRSVSAALCAARLTYSEWAEHGWMRPNPNRGELILLDPALVRQRIDGLPDIMIEALSPDIRSSTGGRYSLSTFFAGDGRFAVGGMSAPGAERFGSEACSQMRDVIKAKWEAMENYFHA